MYYTELITCCYKNLLYTGPQCLLFKKYSLAEVIYLLTSFNKTKSFLWYTKNTAENMRKIHTTHPEKKIISERDSWCYWYLLSIFYWKIINLPPPFFEKFPKLNPLYKGGGSQPWQILKLYACNFSYIDAKLVIHIKLVLLKLFQCTCNLYKCN